MTSRASTPTPPRPTLEELFRESVGEMLRLAAHGLGVKFGIARFAGEDAIVNDPDAPVEEEARLAAMEATDGGRFYAAVKLVDSAGQPRGRVGFLDSRVQALTDSERRTLIALGHALTRVLEMRDLALHGRDSDVTNRRQLEQELEQLNRLSRLGRLAAQVAHEFNNVMMGIQPAVEVIRRLGAENPQIVRMTDLISSSVSRGKGITSDILRFGRPARLSLRPLSTEELFRPIAGEIQSLLPNGITLQLELPQLPLSICGDREQLSQTLINLALNARDAMPAGGGTLTIGARPGHEHTAYSVAEIPNSEAFVHINVTDTGKGISSEDLPYIFEPLFTTKKTGTGLGLSVVYQVVTGHGGHIFVETKRDQGTTFHLFIPRALPRPAANRAERPVAPASPPKPRVLVVEDEVNIATGLRWVLEAEGMTVHVVGRVADVVPAIEEFDPEVMLLDVSLPDGDGRTVYQLVSGRGLQVIFMTGSLGAHELIESGHGAVPVLLKPYGVDELLRAIYDVVPIPPAQPAP